MCTPNLKNQRMKVSILETGKLPETLEKKFGNYTLMFCNLFEQLSIVHDLTTHELTKSSVPTNPREADLWIITGSSYGVYDKLKWIPKLKEFIKEISEEQIPLIGICFGHQIIAEAMGGTVKKSRKGWGVGVHRYDQLEYPKWAKKLGGYFSGYASHQDQVIIPPKNSVSIYGSSFCPHAVLAYGNKNNPSTISVQSHPEFSKSLLRDLIQKRMGETIPKEVCEKALLSLEIDPENSKVFKSLLRAINLA